MKIIIKTKNFDLTPSLQDFIEKKFGMVKKFIDPFYENESAALLDIIVEKESNHHRKGDVFVCEAQVQIPGKNIVAIEKSDDLLKAVVACKDELKMEIEKFKVKHIDKVRREQRKSKKEIEI